MMIPDIDDEHLQAVFDDSSSYHLLAEDVELLREFLSQPDWMRENLGQHDREQLLRIQLATVGQYRSQS